MKKKHLSNEELVVLSRQIALVLSSDLSLQEGLDLITEQSDDSRITDLIGRIKQKTRDGKTLGDALFDEKSLLPAFYIDMVRIGEESGNTQTVLTRIAESYEKEIKTDKKVRSAVTYPTVLFILMLGVIVLLVTTVMPMFKDILSSIGGSIPPFTEAIVNVSSFIGQNIIAILIILAALLLLYDIFRNTEKGRKVIDKIKIVMPVQKDILISISAVRFSRNMSMLLKSGIDIGRSFLLIEPVMANKVLSDCVKSAAKRINDGGTLGEVLTDIKLFPKLLIKLLAVAESTGHMEAMFDKAADLMEEELDSRLDRLTTILEPLLIIILSLILGIILLSVIFPVIGIMNSIG